MEVDKIVPIINRTKNQPAFFVTQKLTKADTDEIVKMYDIIIMAEQKKLFLNKRPKNINPW